jgi:hypothetical protein
LNNGNCVGTGEEDEGAATLDDCTVDVEDETEEVVVDASEDVELESTGTEYFPIGQSTG